MRKSFLLFVLCVPFYLHAENTAPSSVDLTIPPVVIEFENRSLQVMDFKIPDYGDIDLPDFEIELPDPGEIPIKDVNLNLPLPNFVEYKYTEKPSFFSEGTLGIGNRNHLIGNISLFRLGKGSRFSLSFAHDGLDGFGKHDAGTGYFSRSDIFKGDFNNGNESLMFTGSGSFKENEDGLQGQVSSYTSIIHRLSYVQLGLSGTRKLSWNAKVGVNLAGETLTGDVPDSKNELAISIGSGLNWEKDWFSTSLNGEYSYNKQSGFDKNILKADLIFGFALKSLDITSNAGIFWVPGESPIFPFSLSLDGAFHDVIEYQSSAGYLVENYLNYNTWTDHPYFEISRGIDKGWFFDGQITVSLTQSTEVGVHSLYRKMESYLSADPFSFNTVSGLYSVESIKGNFLDISPFVKIAVSSEWNFSLGWDGQLLSDADVLKPVHSVYSELSFDKGPNGFSLNGNYSLEPFLDVPTIGMGIHYLISDGVILSLEGQDILGFFTEERILLGSYIKDGGKIILLTKISL